LNFHGSASNRGQTYRLSNIQSTEKKIKTMLRSKRSPNQVGDRLYDDAIKRRKSREAIKSSSKSPNKRFNNDKSKYYLLAGIIQEFNEACGQYINSHAKQELDFLKTFDIMKMLGFIRQKDNISQSEINSDKALFMDFWQNLDKHKDEVVNRELLISF